MVERRESPNYMRGFHHDYTDEYRYVADISRTPSRRVNGPLLPGEMFDLQYVNYDSKVQPGPCLHRFSPQLFANLTAHLWFAAWPLPLSPMHSPGRAARGTADSADAETFVASGNKVTRFGLLDTKHSYRG